MFFLCEGAWRDIPVVADAVAQVAQGLRDARGAVGIGAHEAALAALAAVHRAADEDAMLLAHVASPEMRFAAQILPEYVDRQVIKLIILIGN